MTLPQATCPRLWDSQDEIAPCQDDTRRPRQLPRLVIDNVDDTEVLRLGRCGSDNGDPLLEHPDTPAATERDEVMDTPGQKRTALNGTPPAPVMLLRGPDPTEATQVGAVLMAEEARPGVTHPEERVAPEHPMILSSS